MADKIMK